MLLNLSSDIGHACKQSLLLQHLFPKTTTSACRRPAQSPYGSYGSKSYGYHRYNGEPEGPSWGDYDDDYVPYSSSRWNYY